MSVGETIKAGAHAVWNMIRLPVCLLVLLLLACLLFDANTLLFHTSFPVTHSYHEINVTERMVMGGLFCQDGVIVTDTGDTIPIRDPDVFWKAVPGHRYLIEISYNVSVFDTVPSGVSPDMNMNLSKYGRITNITLAD